MHGITSAARSGLRAAVALAIVVMLGALFATPAAAAPAPATPDANAPAAGSSLGLGLQLLGLSVKVNVLPLDLTQLVTIGTASSTPAAQPTTPPTSVPPPPTSRSAGQPTGGHPGLPARSTVPIASANVGNPGGAGPSATSTVTTAPPPATVTKSAPPKKPRPAGSLNLVQGLLPHTGPLLLIVMIVGTALAVALMVRLSARRGGRRV
jgi:hypothetical protein